jgi:hypothetical protein
MGMEELHESLSFGGACAWVWRNFIRALEELHESLGRTS